MNTEIKALQFEMNDDARAYLEKKLERIHNAESMIVDLIITLKKEKDFEAAATVNLRWGNTVRVSQNDFELRAAIDKMIDKLDLNITKEKEKVSEKR